MPTSPTLSVFLESVPPWIPRICPAVDVETGCECSPDLCSCHLALSSKPHSSDPLGGGQQSSLTQVSWLACRCFFWASTFFKMKGKIPAGTEFWNQAPLGPGCSRHLPKPKSGSRGLRLQLILTLLFLCFFFCLFLVVLFFLNPQLWCDFDKSIPLKNLTFNSSAVFTDICSYPEVFIHELPLARLGLRYLHSSRWTGLAEGLRHASTPEARLPSSASPVSSASPSASFLLAPLPLLPVSLFLILPPPFLSLHFPRHPLSSFPFPSLPFSFPVTRLKALEQNVLLSPTQGRAQLSLNVRCTGKGRMEGRKKGRREGGKKEGRKRK